MSEFFMEHTLIFHIIVIALGLVIAQVPRLFLKYEKHCYGTKHFLIGSKIFWGDNYV